MSVDIGFNEWWEQYKRESKIDKCDIPLIAELAYNMGYIKAMKDEKESK